jgi:hypothetical protein
MKRFSCALLGLLGGLGGCGWHAGLSAPAGARSVGVEAARREGSVLERGLEPSITDAVSEAIVNWVQLPLVAPADADLVVRIEVLDYRRRGGVRTPDNELIETAVFVRARAELFDRRSKRTLGTPAVAQAWSGYALDDPTNEDAARERALRHVAETLVLDLFDPRSPESSEDAPSDERPFD